MPPEHVMITEKERASVASFKPAERLCALYWLQYKKAKGKDWDKRTENRIMNAWFECWEVSRENLDIDPETLELINEAPGAGANTGGELPGEEPSA